jgi:hypothetical protein
MRKNTVPVFIDKTWEMLQDNGNCLIVRWRPDGNSFEITDETLFIEQVLPRYFKHANFSSFIRQVSLKKYSLTCTTSINEKQQKGLYNFATNFSEEINSILVFI